MDGETSYPKLNPHYQPEVMRWNFVEIEVPPGFKMTHQEHGGSLLVKLWPPDAEVPLEAQGDALLLLPPGHRVFVIQNDERGPPVDHKYTPDAAGLCFICGGDGCGWREWDLTENSAQHVDS
jgi:hypothetical protein